MPSTKSIYLTENLVKNPVANTTINTTTNAKNSNNSICNSIPSLSNVGGSVRNKTSNIIGGDGKSVGRCNSGRGGDGNKGQISNAEYLQYKKCLKEIE
jgi:hypothetical protein